MSPYIMKLDLAVNSSDSDGNLPFGRLWLDQDERFGAPTDIPQSPTKPFLAPVDVDSHGSTED